MDETDVVIVPSMAMDEEVDWVPGRYPEMVAWIRAMHERGATVCSACTGAMLTAETGLLDGHEATIHWVTEAYFRERHPEVVLRLDEVLVVSGEGGRLVTSGAATAWHDLGLYLVARHVGPATAQALARFHLLQWHQGGQAAFQVFDPATDHGDAVVLAAQRWIAENYAVAAPVTEMVRRSGLSLTHLQAPLQGGDRRDDDLLRPAHPGGTGEARARDRRRADRGDQLGGGLRGPGLVPPAVQARDRPDAGRVPSPLPASRSSPREEWLHDPSKSRRCSSATAMTADRGFIRVAACRRRSAPRASSTRR